MGAHRDLAITAMNVVTLQSIAITKDFMARAGLPIPKVTSKGSIPTTLRTQVLSDDLKLPADVVLQWTIGDYIEGKECSAYYDPSSPWYNVFFGAYAIRSYKLDGQAFGYKGTGKPDFDEFMKVPAIDYNYFTAGQFGCPPEKMSFEVLKLVESTAEGWNCAQFEADVPSCIHDPASSLAQPNSYIVYGIPGKEFYGDREPYEKLSMSGQMYMQQVPKGLIKSEIPQPITFAFGASCIDNDEGQHLLTELMAALKEQYLGMFK